MRSHRLVEAFLRAEPRLGFPPDTHGAAVGEDAPRLHGVGELDLEDLADLGLEARIQHRERDLDAAVEVAGHPVRGGEQVFRVLTVLEVEDPRVLEVTVDDGDDADPRREPGHRGAQATRAAHDQVDPYARLAGVVQLLDQATVDQPVHLRDDPRGPPGPSMVRLTADALDEPVAQIRGREQEVVEATWARVAGEEIEQRGEVLAERVAAGEEPEIAVDATRPHVVVPGGQVAVAPQAVSLLPDDEARLAVGLEARAAVDDVSAHLLERTGPADVRFLIEARL